jgi:hypothetical protein
MTRSVNDVDAGQLFLSAMLSLDPWRRPNLPLLSACVSEVVDFGCVEAEYCSEVELVWSYPIKLLLDWTFSAQGTGICDHRNTQQP